MGVVPEKEEEEVLRRVMELGAVPEKEEEVVRRGMELVVVPEKEEEAVRELLLPLGAVL